MYTQVNRFLCHFQMPRQVHVLSHFFITLFKFTFSFEKIALNQFLQNEDDGVILSAIIWGHGDANKVGLLVLCAKTLKEIGRCTFVTPGPIPKCLHGWFAPK